MKIKNIPVSFVTMLFILFSVPFIHAQTTRYVPCGSSAPCYATIQAAITASVNGDTIKVNAGTYTGNVTINKNISLISINGAAATILDGNNAGSELGTIQLSSGVNGATIGSIGHGFTIKGIDGTPAIEKAAIYLQGQAEAGPGISRARQ